MDNRKLVERVMKNLSFEVEAIPNSKSNKPSSSSSKVNPMNVKIKVRKKDTNGPHARGFISNNQSDPEKLLTGVRLVSSYDTIMSFDMMMEPEYKKEKSRRHFFEKFKTGARNDEDEPYVNHTDEHIPSRSSSKVSQVNKSEGNLTQKYTLSEDMDGTIRASPIKRTQRTFLGKKCKPGGCLDPPFGEDTYSYKPKIRNATVRNKATDSKADTKTEDKEKFKIRNNKQKRSKDVLVVIDPLDAQYSYKPKVREATMRNKSTDSKVDTNTERKEKYRKGDDKQKRSKDVSAVIDSVDAQKPDPILNLYTKGYGVPVDSKDKDLRRRKSTDDNSKQSIEESYKSFFIPPKDVKRDSKKYEHRDSIKHRNYKLDSIKDNLFINTPASVIDSIQFANDLQTPEPNNKVPSAEFTIQQRNEAPVIPIEAEKRPTESNFYSTDLSSLTAAATVMPLTSMNTDTDKTDVDTEKEIESSQQNSADVSEKEHSNIVTAKIARTIKNSDSFLIDHSVTKSLTNTFAENFVKENLTDKPNKELDNHNSQLLTILNISSAKIKSTDLGDKERITITYDNQYITEDLKHSGNSLGLEKQVSEPLGDVHGKEMVDNPFKLIADGKSSLIMAEDRVSDKDTRLENNVSQTFKHRPEVSEKNITDIMMTSDSSSNRYPHITSSYNVKEKQFPNEKLQKPDIAKDIIVSNGQAEYDVPNNQMASETKLTVNLKDTVEDPLTAVKKNITRERSMSSYESKDGLESHQSHITNQERNIPIQTKISSNGQTDIITDGMETESSLAIKSKDTFKATLCKHGIERETSSHVKSENDVVNTLRVQSYIHKSDTSNKADMSSNEHTETYPNPIESEPERYGYEMDRDTTLQVKSKNEDVKTLPVQPHINKSDTASTADMSSNEQTEIYLNTMESEPERYANKMERDTTLQVKSKNEDVKTLPVQPHIQNNDTTSTADMSSNEHTETYLNPMESEPERYAYEMERDTTLQGKSKNEDVETLPVQPHNQNNDAVSTADMSSNEQTETYLNPMESEPERYANKMERDTTLQVKSSNEIVNTLPEPSHIRKSNTGSKAGMSSNEQTETYLNLMESKPQPYANKAARGTTLRTHGKSKADNTLPIQPYIKESNFINQFNNSSNKRGKKYVQQTESGQVNEQTLSVKPANNVKDTVLVNDLVKPEQPGTESVKIGLVFHSYVNSDNERICKTVRNENEVRRRANDNVTVINSHIKTCQDNYPKFIVPIDAMYNMTIKITKNDAQGNPGKSQGMLQFAPKSAHTSRSATNRMEMEQKIFKQEITDKVLQDVYEQQLIPLHEMIRDLKTEIDVLAKQRNSLKNKIVCSKKY